MISVNRDKGFTTGIEELAESLHSNGLRVTRDFKAEEDYLIKCVSLIERMEEESDKFRRILNSV